jgi:hypothetical protein
VCCKLEIIERRSKRERFVTALKQRMPQREAQ